MRALVWNTNFLYLIYQVALENKKKKKKKVGGQFGHEPHPKAVGGTSCTMLTLKTTV